MQIKNIYKPLKQAIMKASINKSSLMSLAHIMFAKAEFSTFAEALKQAWKVMKLKAQMAKGIVEFSYRKVSDGSIRHAVGTFKEMSSYIKGTGKSRSSLDNVCYIDIEKGGFRSFCACNLI